MGEGQGGTATLDIAPRYHQHPRSTDTSPSFRSRAKSAILAIDPARRYKNRSDMPFVNAIDKRPRSLVLAFAALLGLIALALPLSVFERHTHHSDGPGLYDAQCPLLALGGLRMVGHAPGAPDSTSLVLVAAALVVVAPIRRSSAPARHTDPRAPPLA